MSHKCLQGLFSKFSKHGISYFVDMSLQEKNAWESLSSILLLLLLGISFIPLVLIYQTCSGSQSKVNNLMFLSYMIELLNLQDSYLELEFFLPNISFCLPGTIREYSERNGMMYVKQQYSFECWSNL